MQPTNRKEAHDKRLVELEELILLLDGTLADPWVAQRKGYLTRNLTMLRLAAIDIRKRRKER